MLDITQIAKTTISQDFGGVTVTCGKFTMLDAANFVEWALDKKVQGVLKNIPDASSSERAIIDRQIRAEGLDIDKELGQIPGMIHIIGVCARKIDPEITDEVIGNLVTCNIDNLIEMNSFISRLMDQDLSPKNVEKGKTKK